ncbi:uncharacterized protein CcaverHIS019_0208950 [Cutaneotrichosporon cavernicola]|uniref:Uncharacterized protein n=1 Tax=Cutaneotrichosporon cavernicola TaxID=279322 RepID=A0AA48IFW8_9TREE|nr:uncharacterized protein CcaverHIS019_0208950 [Cutaneotrichosporon cavernicola]BEI89533.1 hypothetical protein CcaverHIS019_0208950 [Cutaneotrichosporon cavernicola]
MINYARYPDIVERIALHAGWRTQLSFRAASRKLLAFVDALLFEHIAIDLSAASAQNANQKCALLRHPIRHHALPLIEFPFYHPTAETTGSIRLLSPTPPPSALSALYASLINLPSALPVPPVIASKLSCTTTDCFDDKLPLLGARASPAVHVHRAALTERWERALRLASVVELRGDFDPAALSFWSPGGRVKKLLARRDVALVLDQRWGSGISPLSGDTWVCWLNPENAPRGAFDLAPPSGACAVVANFEWRRGAELSFDPIAAFLGSDEITAIASAGGEVTLVFHVRGEREDLRPMQSAKSLIEALAAFLVPKRYEEEPTLTLVGLEGMDDADAFAMAFEVLEPPPRRSVPTAWWCLARSLQEHAGIWCPDRLTHLTIDQWITSAGRHASLMVDPAPFVLRPFSVGG